MLQSDLRETERNYCSAELCHFETVKQPDTAGERTTLSEVARAVPTVDSEACPVDPHRLDASAENEFDALSCKVLQELGRSFHADFALFWKADDSGEICCTRSWTAIPDLDLFVLAPLLELKLWPVEGLPGRVWANGISEVLRELDQDGHGIRSSVLAKLGVRMSIGIPFKTGMNVLGVIELLSRDRFLPKLMASEFLMSVTDELGDLYSRDAGGK